MSIKVNLVWSQINLITSFCVVRIVDNFAFVSFSERFDDLTCRSVLHIPVFACLIIYFPNIIIGGVAHALSKCDLTLCGLCR